MLAFSYNLLFPVASGIFCSKLSGKPSAKTGPCFWVPHHQHHPTTPCFMPFLILWWIRLFKGERCSLFGHWTCYSFRKLHHHSLSKWGFGTTQQRKVSDSSNWLQWLEVSNLVLIASAYWSTLHLVSEQPCYASALLVLFSGFLSYEPYWRFFDSIDVGNMFITFFWLLFDVFRCVGVEKSCFSFGSSTRIRGSKFGSWGPGSRLKMTLFIWLIFVYILICVCF